MLTPSMAGSPPSVLTQPEGSRKTMPLTAAPMNAAAMSTSTT